MIFSKFRTALRTPPKKYFLLIKVLRLSLHAWYLDRFAPAQFRPELQLVAGLKKPKSDKDIQCVKNIAWAIRVVSKLTPWTNVCRHQAWQGAVLLNQSGFSFLYSVGTKKNSAGVLEGHSWILSANRFISGRCNVGDYVVLNKYE